MRRRWWIVIVVLGVIVVGAAFAFFRDTATPVDAAAAEASFAGGVGTEPGDPGVYAYTTSGHEEVDALGGGRHDYPGTTYATITQGECGPVVRWQPLEERWVEWEHCGSDLAITRTSEYHRWFGVADTELEECPEPRSITVSTDAVACPAPDTTETYRVEVLGTEVLSVEGQDVEVVHLRRTSYLTGESAGDSTVEVWRLVGSPLIVRMVADSSNVTPSAVGDVRYTEHFQIDLQHLLPTG